ncbi:TPA: hypothetical protein DEP96_01365 [Candidatus Uhrbacteria bacterium]|nr:hypothetical protein [Candidatus Uhrbacteria bacterium]
MLFDTITSFIKNGAPHQLTTGDHLLFLHRGNPGNKHYSLEVVFRTGGYGASSGDICAVHNTCGFVQNIAYLPITRQRWIDVLASQDRLADRLNIDFVLGEVSPMFCNNLLFDVKPRT